MNRRWFHAITILLVVFVLSGCGKTLEEQIDVGITGAQTKFEDAPQAPNKTIGEIELYVPSGYNVKQSDDLNNLLITKGKDQFILFVNTYEKEDSKLHYELLKKDTSKELIEEQTFQSDDAFGFIAVIEMDEEQYELIASNGGVKISTLSEEKKIDLKLVEMMEIVRSVKVTE